MYVPNSMVVANILLLSYLSKMSVYASPNPEQPFSRAEGCERFCYRDEDHFIKLSRAVFIAIDQIHLIKNPNKLNCGWTRQFTWYPLKI